MIGGILFLSCLSVCLFVCLFVCLSVCLFVCLSVVNFNLRYNFWTVRDRDFIFGIHTPLMMPFQMTPRSMTLWPWLWPWSYKQLFSSPEPKAQVSYCHSAPSVVRPSVRPSSSVVRKLSHFRLLLWNRWTEFNETWQEARSQRPLPSLCFSGRS